MKNSDMPAMPQTRYPSPLAVSQAAAVGMIVEPSVYGGLSKREHFAAMYGQGIVTGLNNMYGDDVSSHGWSNDDVADHAVDLADALLKRLEKNNGDS